MANSSYPKTSRLLNAGEFQAVFSHSQFKVSCRYFLVLAKTNDQNNTRIGLVVGKKNVSKAVQRNRVKRLIRDWFRRHQEFSPNLDMIVLVRKEADTLNNQQLLNRRTSLWDDLNTKCLSAGN